MSLKLERTVSVTLDMTECKSGEFVGDVKEFPLMVLGNDEEDLIKKMWDALIVYVSRHPEEIHKFKQG